MSSSGATNITSLTVLFGILGKRATAIYLVTIAVFAVGFGLAVDQVYAAFSLSPRAMVGAATEIIPGWVQVGGAVVLMALSVKPIYLKFRQWFGRKEQTAEAASCGCASETPAEGPGCGCSEEAKVKSGSAGCDSSDGRAQP